MISCTDGKRGCCYISRQWIVFNDVVHVKDADYISNCMMGLFNDIIGLRIPSCDWFPFEAIVFLTHFSNSAINLVPLSNTISCGSR